MMKFVSVLGFFLALCSNVWADVCYDIDSKTAKKAIEIIQAQKEIYLYCSICQDAEPEPIHVNNLQKGNPVYVNDIALDLAHTYYKKGNKFVNLGVASGCIKTGEYGIAAELDNLPSIHRIKENSSEYAKQNTQKIYVQCVEQIRKKDPITTADMMEQDAEINDCLTNAINQEIIRGFAPKQQQEMIEYISQIRKTIWKLYFDIYAGNKYCYGACGTITNILPYADEGKILMDILEKLIYLNLTKNGY